MYVRNGITVRSLILETLPVALPAAIWSVVVILIYEDPDLPLVALPAGPVTTMGVAVSLYLGFKTTSAYSRWWEARQIWGAIVNDSRIWANQVFSMVGADGRVLEGMSVHGLTDRHLAWVNALAFQLRRNSRLRRSVSQRIFDFRRNDLSFVATSSADCFGRYLSSQEMAEVSERANPATHILRKQGEALRELRRRELIDDNRMVELIKTIGRLYDAQGKCERIKNTPFPWVITYFGRIFTWVYLILLPMAFVDTFYAELVDQGVSKENVLYYMTVMVALMVIISWVFYMIEKVSESCEDPFEGGATDVPISSLTRTIEIDVLQMAGSEKVPEPASPIDGVLY